MTPEEAVAAALAARFPDGRRRATLLVGAGLHQHLRDHSGGVRRESWRRFCDWDGLLASAAGPLGIEQIRQSDPTATWESLIVRAAPVERRGVAQCEDGALRHVANTLAHPPASPGLLRAFGSALDAARFADVVCLNFDPTLDLARRAAPPSRPDGGRHGRRLTLHSPGATRVWYPHGHTTDPESLQLGLHAYAMGLGPLEPARKRAKVAEKLWDGARIAVPRSGPWSEDRHLAWEGARRMQGAGTESFALTWLDQLLWSPLVVIGAGLDRGELDLWWALHTRARNLARVPDELRPPAVLLTTASALGRAPHLARAPARLQPVIFPTWDAAWEAVLGRWW